MNIGKIIITLINVAYMTVKQLLLPIGVFPEKNSSCFMPLIRVAYLLTYIDHLTVEDSELTKIQAKY